MTIYYKCNMKKQEHILAYIICSLIEIGRAHV